MGEHCCGGCGNHSHHEYVISLDTISYKDEKSLKNLLEQNYGICHVKIDLFAGTLTIVYEKAKITEKEVKQALNSPNFILKKTMKRWIGAFNEKYSNMLKMVVSTILFIISWSFFIALREGYELPDLKFIVINLTGIIIAGIPIFSFALKSLKKKKLTVHLLISIAVVGTILLGHWMEALTVLVITLWGEFLEDFTLKRSKKDFSASFLLGARSVLVKDGDKIIEVPLHKAKKDQVVLVKQGMKIPLDGVIVKGKANVDESPITGESTFREKNVKDSVFAGSIVEMGSLEIKVTTVGTETVIAQIAKLVEKAREEKSDSEKMVDKFACYIIPIVLFLGFMIFVINYMVLKLGFLVSFGRGITGLVVACPCAVILATPTAVSAGLAIAARKGIIFKTAKVIEILSKIKVLFLDKTGTLTHNRPKIVEIKTFDNYTKEEVLICAGMAEKNSTHPLAKSVLEKVKQDNLSIEDPDSFFEFEGGGVAVKKGEDHIKVGGLWLMEDGREISKEVTDCIGNIKNKGYTSVLVTKNEAVIGAILFEDEIRKDASSVLARVRQQGVEHIVMLTGDHKNVAETVSAKVGVDQYFADCMPDTKIEQVTKAKENNILVAMVGDGINDAPALASADVGITMGALGSEAAIEAGDVCLMKDDFAMLNTAINISSEVSKTIKYNLFFAVFFNLVMIVFVFFGKIDILLGAILHQVSVLAVILNSLRFFVRRFK
jgi:Zn2+/Cd2+-exporting ATPase